MKLHIVTVGKPKLAYAVSGVDEYLSRLKRLHEVRITNIADKYAYDAGKIAESLRATTVVALELTGKQYSSEELAKFLTGLELQSKEVSFLIGGPEGLPQEIRGSADHLWSLGKHTMPHDLAMVATLEAIYRASTIKAGLPYHK